MKRAQITLALVVALLVISPFVLPAYHVTLLNYIGLAALVALGLVVMTGVGGIVSFGQQAFEHAVGVGVETVHGQGVVLPLEPEDLVALTIEAAAMAQVPLAGTQWIPGRKD